MLKVLDLFSGLGGFSLGLERTGGFETVAFCEIEEFPRKVLKKHWPEIPIYEDVRELTAERLGADGITPDIITGGFPCQDISVAGKQKGIRDGERSSLFDEIIRLTRDIRPRYVICENVSALLSGSNGEWFSYVLTEFSRIGYDCEWESISAQEVGAWHKRDRVWIIAYQMGNSESESSNELQSDRENSECKVSESGNTSSKDNISNTNNTGHTSPKCEIDEDWKKRGEEWEDLAQSELSRQGDDVSDPRCKLRSKRDSEGMEADKTIRTHSELHDKSSSQGQSEDNVSNPNSIGESSRPGEVQEKDGEISKWNDHAESNDTSSEFPNTMQQGLQGSENPRSLEGSWQNINKLIARCSESLSMWESEPSMGRVANGISAELDIYGGLIYEEEHDKEKNAETLREPRGRLLRVMWEQRETAKTSPDLYRKRLSDCMSEVPHFDSHGGWYLGAWIEENKGLCDLWEEFYSKPFEEAQDLQQELLERIRKIERTKEVGPTKDRSHRLKGLGNAVVPQIPQLLGYAIMEYEKERMQEMLD